MNTGFQPAHVALHSKQLPGTQEGLAEWGHVPDVPPPSPNIPPVSPEIPPAIDEPAFPDTPEPPVQDPPPQPPPIIG